MTKADSSKTFTFQGHTYSYFSHEYSTTWLTERTVEVPIIWEIVHKYHGKRILEVGNVLSHYYPVEHDIVDKYEKAPGVINEDVVDYKPSEKYDLIVSISTLEHVGWDAEEPKDPMKILAALENLKSCLAPGGEIVVTLPLGQNLEMDKLLKENKIHFTKQHFLKRISADNQWIEAAWKDVCNAAYFYPFPWANGLVIGILNEPC
ncbi:MAG: methyltransferase domain-containing protein [Eubacteriales bacterium]